MKRKDKSYPDNIRHIYHELLKQHQPSPTITAVTGPLNSCGVIRGGEVCSAGAGCTRRLICAVLPRRGAVAWEHGWPGRGSVSLGPWLPSRAVAATGRSVLPVPPGPPLARLATLRRQRWGHGERRSCCSLCGSCSCLVNVAAQKASRPGMCCCACSSSHVCEKETAQRSPVVERGLQRWVWEGEGSQGSARDGARCSLWSGTASDPFSPSVNKGQSISLQSRQQNDFPVI